MVVTATGGAAIDRAISTDSALLEKAEFSTGISRDNLTVVSGSVSGALDSVNYDVKDGKGNLYKCFYTTAVITDSMSICRKISKDGDEAAKAGCNEIQRAAGLC